MKYLILLLVSIFIFTTNANSQAPQLIKYQAVIRNSTGQIISNQKVALRISILQGSINGTSVYTETQVDSSNAEGIICLNLGSGSQVTGSFPSIDWSAGPYFLQIELDVTGGNAYSLFGKSQLLSVPYALFAGKSAGGNSKFEIQAVNQTSTDSALFVVRDRNGNPVFTVFENGVDVTYDESVKGSKTGFTVGGRTQAKGTINNIMAITSDSVNFYLDTTQAKGARGGFTVGGRTPGAKGSELDFFKINGSNTTDIINPSESRILWYPAKEAFLAGRVLIESPDSVGTNATVTGFESKAIGNWSQAFGYRSIARQNYSTAIGKTALAGGVSSFALGEGAQALSNFSYAFGSHSQASGIGSFAFGYPGRDSAGITGDNTVATGDFSFAFGLGARASSLGAFAFGAQNIASGQFSTALGYETKAQNWYSFTIGDQTVSSGVSAIAMGYQTLASGWTSMAMGGKTIASGGTSIAGGWGSIASGDGSFAWGYNTVASGHNGFAIGNQSVAIGENSLAFGDSSVALGFASTSLGSHSLALAISSVSIGDHSVASGWASVAFGGSNTASGSTTLVSGFGCKALGDGSLAFGYRSTSVGQNSFALGNLSISLGPNTFAAGTMVRAVGDNSFASGYGTIAKTYDSFVIGQYNDTSGISASGWDDNDALFVIGNGDVDSLHNALTVLKNGNLGIGKANPVYALDIAKGFASVAPGYGWLTPSDARYKTNIISMTGVLEKVLSLRAVRYDLKTDPSANPSSPKHIGFIAQELEKVFPEFVQTNANGYKSVAYDQLAPVLVEAIKEQQDEIQSLKIENEKLKTSVEKINEIEGRLKLLENHSQIK